MGKIHFVGHNPATQADLEANIAHSKTLGLPYAPKPKPREIVYHDRTLAVVGGGPSVVEHLVEIGQYAPRDIWAINGACGFLRGYGIESTLFSLDPCDFLAPRVEGAKRAILSSRCHPKVFETLKGCDITLFDMLQDHPDEIGIWGSCSTVMSSFDLSSDYGYRKLVFYGCEGSYMQATHAYMDDSQKFRFVVECGGLFYKTLPELYVGAVEHAKFLRMNLIPPASWTEKSGGLLRALVKNEDHDIVQVSNELLSGLKPIPVEKPTLQERILALGDYHAAINEQG